MLWINNILAVIFVLYDVFLYTTILMNFRLLNEAQGSLLDDEQLVNTLQNSKATSQEVTEQLQTAETTEAKIDAAREVTHSEIYDILELILGLHLGN